MSGDTAFDPRNLTFSQAYGYEELPQPLKLEELSKKARLKLWGLLYEHFSHTKVADVFGQPHVSGTWKSILALLHVDFFELPLDEFDTSFSSLVELFKECLFRGRFQRVFDLLLAIMRHPKCPHEFIQGVAIIFEQSRLAYVVDVASPPTIFPATTEEEGEGVLRAIAELNKAGLAGAVSHLRQASDCIGQGDYAGAVRDSIHAVESTARQIDPNAKTLDPALKSLERAGALHPALKQAFSNLYGYTSDEQGIRHALIDNPQPNVGQDEAVFMLGACASFSSYLARKHQRQPS